MKSCNVCGVTCKKSCSVCGLVYYCSVACQRKDWKSHKRVCKRKRKKPPQVSGTKKKIKPTGLQLETLPDEVLVHIGKSVADLAGVRGFVRLAQTSKRFHGLLMDAETVSSVVQTQNDWIHEEFCTFDNYIPLPTNLEEVALCEYVSMVKRDGLMSDNKVYYGDRGVVNAAHATRLIKAIAWILKNNRSTWAILDANSNMEPDLDFRHASLRSELMAKDMIRGLQLNCISPLGEEKTEEIISRIRIRCWGTMVTTKVSELDDDHGRKIREGKGWVEIFFRMGDIGEMGLPFLPDYYLDIPVPEEKMFDHYDKLKAIDTRPPDVDVEEYFLGLINNFSGVENAKLVLETMLVEFRVQGTTSLGPEMDGLMRDLMRQRGLEPLGPNQDPRELLMEIISRTTDGLEDALGPDEVILRLQEHGETGLGPFFDGLVRGVINQRAERRG